MKNTVLQKFSALCLSALKAPGESAKSSLVETKEVADAEIETRRKRVFNIEGFAAGTQEERSVLSQGVLRRHNSTVLKLEKIVQETIEDPSQCKATAAAIRLLGRLHARHAVELLVQNLTFTPAFDTTDPSALKTFPAVRALILIGIPALPAVVQRASADDHPLVTRLCARIVRELLGPKVGETYLREALSRGHDDAATSRLARLADRVSGVRSLQVYARGGDE